MQKNQKGLETFILKTPVEFQKPTGELRQPSGCNSYVYKITYTKNGKMYIGYHKDGDTPYRCSSTNTELQELLACGEPEILTLEILSWGSVSECQQEEYELLTKVDAKNNPMYFNKWNGKPGIRKLNIGLVNELENEINDIRTFKNQKTHTYFNVKTDVKEFSIKQLSPNNLDSVQVRELWIDSQNLSKVIDRIKERIGSYDMPVILENVTYRGKFYNYLLISGNHTRTAYWKTRNKNVGHTQNTKLKCLVIPEDITHELSDREIDMLGNNLNADYNVGKPFSVGDAVSECVEHYLNGYSWDTVEMRHRYMRLGLTSSQFKTVQKNVYDQIQKKEWEAAGKVVYNYIDDDNHKKLLERKAKSFTSNDTFVITTSSGNPHLYRLIETYYIEQYDRISNGLKPQTNLKLVVYHTNTKSQKEWKGLFEKMFRPQNLPLEYGGYDFTQDDLNILKSLVTYPTTTYYEMPMYGSRVTKRTLKKSKVRKKSNTKIVS